MLIIFSKVCHQGTVGHTLMGNNNLIENTCLKVLFIIHVPVYRENSNP